MWPILFRVGGLLLWILLHVVLVLLHLAGLASLASLVASLLWAVLAAAAASGLRADAESQVLGTLLRRFERLPFAHVASLDALLLRGVGPLLRQEVPKDAATAGLPEYAVAVVVADRTLLWRFGRVDSLRIECFHLLEGVDELTAQLVGLQL